MTIDGTDCRIQEPRPFSSEWYSHKFKGPGLRYEVGVSIQTGWIVWVHGPYPCGSYSDLAIFRLKLKGLLQDAEKVLADGGYKDGVNGKTVNPNGLNDWDQYMKKVARARHETINGKLKSFAILGDRYRGNLLFHKYIFMAIANLVQVGIETSDTVFQVEYNDRPNNMQI